MKAAFITAFALSGAALCAPTSVEARQNSGSVIVTIQDLSRNAEASARIDIISGEQVQGIFRQFEGSNIDQNGIILGGILEISTRRPVECIIKDKNGDDFKSVKGTNASVNLAEDQAFPVDLTDALISCQ